MADVDGPSESDSPERLRRARQVLEGAYQEARASDYQAGTAAMHVLGRAEQGYQQAKQDEVHRHQPVEQGRDDPVVDRNLTPAPVGGERDRKADQRDDNADARDGISKQRDRDAEERDGLADARDLRLREVMTSAAGRDHDAEQRDRAAERRDITAKGRTEDFDGAAEADRAASAIDRFHSGRDRDAAAVDRSSSKDSAELNALSRRQSGDDRADASVDRLMSSADRDDGRSEREADREHDTQQ